MTKRISLVLDEQLLIAIEDKIKQLKVTRSQYLRDLIASDTGVTPAIAPYGGNRITHTYECRVCGERITSDRIPMECRACGEEIFDIVD